VFEQHNAIQRYTKAFGANKEPDRYSLKEIKWVATINVSDYQKRMDDYSKKIRDLNINIQAANWKFEIN
jgi:hypothetical protein